MVKKREAYRPFAPTVTAEAVRDYFEVPAAAGNHDFMSFVLPVREDGRAELGAVTHIDGTARLQVVDQAVNPRFHRLVTAFGELTGTGDGGLVVNHASSSWVKSRFHWSISGSA